MGDSATNGMAGSFWIPAADILCSVSLQPFCALFPALYPTGEYCCPLSPPPQSLLTTLLLLCPSPHRSTNKPILVLSSLLSPRAFWLAQALWLAAPECQRLQSNDALRFKFLLHSDTFFFFGQFTSWISNPCTHFSSLEHVFGETVVVVVLYKDGRWGYDMPEGEMLVHAQSSSFLPEELRTPGGSKRILLYLLYLIYLAPCVQVHVQYICVFWMAVNDSTQSLLQGSGRTR